MKRSKNELIRDIEVLISSIKRYKNERNIHFFLDRDVIDSLINYLR